MLAGILFLTVIVVVAVLITVDVVRTPTEAAAGQAHGHGPERSMAGARSGPSVHAFPREPAVRDRAVPAAAAGALLGTGAAEVDSFGRPDETARAFDQMRREMSQSAASEAALRGKFNAMYVNLSRRSQALVERQLRLIESLEHGEQDQQRLASLSKLNRIAMRMHRNSQNMLVLAGQDPASGWNQPVTLANLVEAALSEAEDYERVSFEVQPDIAVRGPAVHDAVHLLVELIDNATSFSAAEMPVHVTGRILNSGGALVDITDRGIGMPAKEMAYANQQLDNPPAPDIDVPKWMGLLVVARLAARHGIRVRLNQAELGGLTALVWLPDEILTHYAAPADPGRAAPEQRGAPVSTAPLAAVRVGMPDMLAARPDPAWSARGAQATLQAEPPAARLSRSGGPGALGGDVGVVLPQVDSQARMHGPPIYDEVESHWSRGGREAPGSGGPATAPSPAMATGPATPGGPAMPGGPGGPGGPGAAAMPGSVGGPGGPGGPRGPGAAAAPGGPAVPGAAAVPGGPAASGLPRRPPPAAAGPRATPGTPSGLPSRPGAKGRDGRDARTGFQPGASQSWAVPAEEADPGPEES